MSLLSQILKDEHAALLKHFESLDRMDSASSQFRETFLITKALLLEHLKKEDKYLYPELEKKIGGSEVAKIYIKEMAQVTKEAKQVFEQFDKGDLGMQFSKNLGSFVGSLKQRIIKEESTLFKKFDELCL